MSALINVSADSLVGAVKGVIDRIWPDKSAEEKAALDRELQLELAQIQVNAEQAKAGPMAGKFGAFWIAGARPAAMWACVLGLVLDFTAVHTLSGDERYMLVEIFGGLAGLRTFEKYSKSEGNR